MSYGLKLGWGGSYRGMYRVLGGTYSGIYQNFSPGLKWGLTICFSQGSNHDDFFCHHEISPVERFGSVVRLVLSFVVHFNHPFVREAIASGLQQA